MTKDDVVNLSALQEVPMQLRSVVLAGLVVATGCGGSAASVYPVPGAPQIAAPERAVEQVFVHFDDTPPTCEYTDFAIIRYDWAKDGIMTTADVALKGTRAKAAKLGATGIHKLEYFAGAAVGVAIEGIATASQEVGLQAVAYICDSNEAGSL